MPRLAAAGLLVLAGCGSGGGPDAPIETPTATAATLPAAEPTGAGGTAEANQPPTAAPVEKRFQALGTEPFWSVEVLPGQLRFSSPENIDGTTFAATRITDGTGVRYAGTLDGKPLSLLIEPGTCSDGMSDTVYVWKAALTIDGRTEQGCARTK